MALCKGFGESNGHLLMKCMLRALLLRVRNILAMLKVDDVVVEHVYVHLLCLFGAGGLAFSLPHLWS